MTNLSRLTLAAALLGGMALPAFAHTTAVQAARSASASPSASRVHRHARAVAANDAATAKEVKPKDVTSQEPMAKNAMPKDAAKDASKGSATAAPGETAKPAAPGATVTSPSVTAPVKPAVPGQSATQPKSN